MEKHNGNGEKVDDQGAARWRRLGDLGMEEGLREAGFSKSSITTILKQVRSSGERISQPFWEGGIGDIVSQIKDGRAVLLSLLGRDPAFSVRELWLTQKSIGHLDSNEAMAMCVNLSSNRNVRVLALDEQTVFGTLEGCSLLANTLSNNSSLQSLFLSKVNMGSGAAKCLMDGLKGTKTLEDLSVGYNPLLDEGIGSVAEMLSTNSSLRRLYMYETHSGSDGAEHIASALERNTTLEIFYFGGNAIGSDGMKRLLAPLARGHGADGPKNTTLKELELSNITRDNYSVDAMAWMIRTNNSLCSLSLASTTLLTKDWVDQIFPALRENETLKELDLRSCQGLTMEGCYNALMELIQSSDSGLEEIELTGTGLEPTSAQVEEELRLNSEYLGRQRGQAHLNSTSGRLYLEFISGKATFRKASEPKPEEPLEIDTGSTRSRGFFGGLQRLCRCCCCCVPEVEYCVSTNHGTELLNIVRETR
ncbi:unnamed protein product [Calypogeia fissa]